MGNRLIINNIIWVVRFVSSDSAVLNRSDGSHTVGMTDGNLRTIFIDRNLRGAFLEKVLCHEICHAVCFSYGVRIPIETEELIANWVSMYGRIVINGLDNLMDSINKIGTKAY